MSTGGRQERYAADIVVVACGALSSAQCCCARIGPERIESGLANGSDQVGRNYMRHNNSVLMAFLKKANDYGVSEDAGAAATSTSEPTTGSSRSGTILTVVPRRTATRSAARKLPGLLTLVARQSRSTCVARHAIDFWVSSEDLPLPGQPHHPATATGALPGGARTGRRSASAPAAQAGGAA